MVDLGTRLRRARGRVISVLWAAGLALFKGDSEHRFETIGG